MRASQWLLGGATAATIVAAIASGCGGSTNSNTTQDSGTDATNDVAAEAAPKEAAAEAAPEAAPEAAACVADADITKLNPPDAEIGDSAATQAGCYSCIKTNCGAQLSACNADCTCNTAVEGFLGCIYGGGTPLTCAGPLATAGGTAIALGLCLGGSAVPGGSGPGCIKECGVTLPEGGPPADGGGGDSAGDTGSTDAGGQ